MHQAHFCKGAFELKLWMNWWRLLVKALILHPNISLNSLTVGITPLCEFGYKNMSICPKRDCERLQIVKLLHAC